MSLVARWSTEISEAYAAPWLVLAFRCAPVFRYLLFPPPVASKTTASKTSAYLSTPPHARAGRRARARYYYVLLSVSNINILLLLRRPAAVYQ